MFSCNCIGNPDGSPCAGCPGRRIWDYANHPPAVPTILPPRVPAPVFPPEPVTPSDTVRIVLLEEKVRKLEEKVRKQETERLRLQRELEAIMKKLRIMCNETWL